MAKVYRILEGSLLPCASHNFYENVMIVEMRFLVQYAKLMTEVRDNTLKNIRE
jgi:hypothetical protein